MVSGRPVVRRPPPAAARPATASAGLDGATAATAADGLRLAVDGVAD